MTKIARDGNCFYRALAVSMGNPSDSYGDYKKLIADFLRERHSVFDYMSDLKELEQMMRKEGEAATYECNCIAAEMLERPIHLFRESFPSQPCEIFASDSGPEDAEPIRILFIGNWEYGHFEAIVPKKGVPQWKPPSSSPPQKL